MYRLSPADPTRPYAAVHAYTHIGFVYLAVNSGRTPGQKSSAVRLSHAEARELGKALLELAEQPEYFTTEAEAWQAANVPDSQRIVWGWYRAAGWPDVEPPPLPFAVAREGDPLPPGTWAELTWRAAERPIWRNRLPRTR